MIISSKYFPPDIIARFHIDGLIVVDGYLYIKIVKGVYGLKQAAIIAYNRLIYHMEPHVYCPVTFTTEIWAHKTIGTTFRLFVDDFGVKYFTKDDKNHLLY